MVSAANAPWLQTPDWSAVMSRGASAGSELAGNRLKAEQIANQAQQAAAELGFRYASLAASNARAAADAEAQKMSNQAAMELKGEQEKNRIAQFEREQAAREAGLGLEAARLANASMPEIRSGGSPILQVGRDGTVKELWKPEPKVVPPPLSTRTYKVPEVKSAPADSGKRTLFGIDALWPDKAPTPKVKGHPEYTVRERVPAGAELAPSGELPIGQTAPTNMPTVKRYIWVDGKLVEK